MMKEGIHKKIEIAIKSLTFISVLLLMIKGNVYATDNYTGLRQENDTWIYVLNGVHDTSKTGIVMYGDKWFYVENGMICEDYIGFVDYDGGTFLVTEGRVLSEYSGLIQVGDEWYFLSQGQLQSHYSGLALYDEHWFLLEWGMLKHYSGLYWYDESYFLIADGQIKRDYSGLYEDEYYWYYISNGQVVDYTGFVEYDGEKFYVEEGIMASHYTGYVKYDGGRFWVENGQLNHSEEKETILKYAEAQVDARQKEMMEVLSYVNQYRAEVGAEALVLDKELSVAAMIRAKEMADAGIFSHTRPNGTDCFTVVNELQIEWWYVGENIACGYPTSQAVCNGWYNSPGHYSNMVNTEYGKLGVGLVVASNGRKYWVQLFTD